jgi:SagB-type dehydrogenase family enzyme
MTVVQQETVALPAPRRKGAMSVEECIAARRSRRAYASDPVTLAELGQLLWAAQGITGPEGQRTAPSAGALYPLELYVSASRVGGLAPGIYKYSPENHDLTLHIAGDRRRELTALAKDQDCMRFSACAILFAAVFERTASKYADRALRFVCMEVGHAAENMCLQATALGLGTCVVGAFEPAELRREVQLPKQEEPVSMLTVGRRA